MFGDLLGAMILRIPKASSERYAPHATTALLLPAQTLLFMNNVCINWYRYRYLYMYLAR